MIGLCDSLLASKSLFTLVFDFERFVQFVRFRVCKTNSTATTSILSLTSIFVLLNSIIRVEILSERIKT